MLALLEEQFEVFAPTVAGHTGGPDLAENGTLGDIADGLEAMLDEVGWERPHVAGWSIGGQLALEMAARGRARTRHGDRAPAAPGRTTRHASASSSASAASSAVRTEPRPATPA